MQLHTFTDRYKQCFISDSLIISNSKGYYLRTLVYILDTQFS